MKNGLELVREGALRISEAERFAGVGKSKLYEEMAAGRLAYIQLGGARRIPRRALEEWLANHLMVGGERLVQRDA